MIKTLEIENNAGQKETVKLQIWDTAGQERFRSITQSYYRSAHALILVYDISCQPTFDALTDWIREIQEYANPKVLKILVGNKTDRDDREIPMRVGEEFAKQHDMYFLETSSKQGENGEDEDMQTEMNHLKYYNDFNFILVERLFYEIAAELIEQARQKGGLSSRSHQDSSVTNLGFKNNLGNFQSNCCSGGSGKSN